MSFWLNFSGIICQQRFSIVRKIGMVAIGLNFQQSKIPGDDALGNGSCLFVNNLKLMELGFTVIVYLYFFRHHYHYPFSYISNRNVIIR